MTCRSGEKFLSEYHSSIQLKILEVFRSGKRMVDDPHPRLLLLAVPNELAAQHHDVGIEVLWALALGLISGAMESVAGTVAADEPFAAGDRL